MMKLPERLYQKLTVTCDNCGKETKINVPYVCCQHEYPCDEDYIKVGIDPKNLIYSCNCKGIDGKVQNEYLKMESSFHVEH